MKERMQKTLAEVKGCSGIDKMSCEQMLPWLSANKDALICSLLDGFIPRTVPKIGTAVCGTACTVV